MVTVSSAFISSRRERIIFSVLSASGCAFKAAACVDVLRVLGKTDFDNTDVARDHSFHCIANARILATSADDTMHVGLTVSISSAPIPEFELSVSMSSLTRTSEIAGIPVTRGGADGSASVPRTAAVPASCHPVLQVPSRLRKPVDDIGSFMPVRKTQAGARRSASRPASLSGRR